MPRKDPITGVDVLTFHEFMQKEADIKNVTIDEEYQSFWKDMAKIEKEEEESLKKHGLAYLRKAVEEENQCRQENQEDLLLLPEEIIDFRSLSVPSAYASHQHTRVEAYAKREDGTEGVLCYTRDFWQGNRIEPPEEEVEIWWETT